jgi:DedD protein
MANRMDILQDEKGTSARHLVLMFLAAVAVCAVFFSLGYVVCYNHGPSRSGPVTENVNGPGTIPPTVNPPSGASSQSSGGELSTENVSPGSPSAAQSESSSPQTQEPAAAPKREEHKPRETAAAPRKTVKSKAATPKAPPAAPPPASSSGHFAVQVMASKTRVDAEHLVKLLKSRGYPVYILTPQQAHAHDNLYRVQVGPFTTRVAADQTRDKLVAEGFRPFIVH